MPVLTPRSILVLPAKQGHYDTPASAKDALALQQDEGKRPIVELTQHGCQARLLLAAGDSLDDLVKEDIQKGRLAIAG